MAQSDDLPNLIAQLVATHGPQSVNWQPRPPGRPKTRTDAYYRRLLLEYESARCWFAQTFGRPPRSDRELLRDYLVHELQRQNRRVATLNAPEVAAKVKTFRNNLAEARKLAELQT